MVDAKPTVAALLKTLRQASTAAAAIRIINEAIHLLIATSSMVEVQNLVFGLQQCARTHPHAIEVTRTLHEQIEQAAAICTEPAGKAEFLGFVFFQQSVSLFKTHAMSMLRNALYRTMHMNPKIFSGYLAALTAADGPIFKPIVEMEQVQRTLEFISPVIKAILIDPLQSDGRKMTVLNTIASIAWHFSDNATVVSMIAIMAVEALELVPHSQFSHSAYTAHVALVVDILTSFHTQSKTFIVLAARTAQMILESVQLVIASDVGALTLLQALEQLAHEVPEALWCSVFLASASFFLDQCETFLEQQLILSMLTSTLEFGWNEVASQAKERSVYVEILVLPVSSMLSSHGIAASKLLQRVIAIRSKGTFQYTQPLYPGEALTETAAHAHSAIQVIAKDESCQQWLGSLFSPKDATLSTSFLNTDKWLASLVVALLSDARTSLQLHAGKCLERQVNQNAKFWGTATTKSLVASLLFLVSHHSSTIVKSGPWMTSCLYSLAGLAATTTDTMRIILRLIDRTTETVKMRPMAYTLLYQVYLIESRIYPRLEVMLLESTSADANLERHIVRMATIQALCRKNPDVGVQFISTIQEYLEDTLESVASMAMDAITSLCKCDCLDFYVAFKIIAQKVRKHKIPCADKPLFQEHLCVFYALGGADCASNIKHAVKLLQQVWEGLDSEHSSVRKAAYAVMRTFPLELVGLCMPPDDEREQDGEDQNRMVEAQVEGRVNELMRRLQSEKNSDVRLEIERLIARVMQHESLHLPTGVKRGQRQRQDGTQNPTLALFVSAAATKEMKAMLPARAEVLSMASSLTDCSGFLLAFEPKAPIDTTGAKRKDKLVRLAMQNVDEVLETITMVLEAMELPWAFTCTTVDDCCTVFLQTQAFMEGWWGMMATFLSSLDTLAELKTPVGVDDANVALRVFSEQVTELFHLLLCDCVNKVGGYVAAGALLGQLGASRHWQNPQLQQQYQETIEGFARKLALAIEQSRVFEAHDTNARDSMLGILVALQLSFGQRQSGSREEDGTFYCLLEKVENLFQKVSTSTSDELTAACALLGSSHVAALYMNEKELEMPVMVHWRQQRVHPIAERLLHSFMSSSKQPQERPTVTFSMSKATGNEATLKRVAARYQQRAAGNLLQWASLMGLARLASGFSKIQRLDWLENVRIVLASVWEANECAHMTSVALGPVLLHCVHHNVAPSSSLAQFVADAIQRATDSTADTLGCGFLIMSVAYVLCRSDTLGGFRRTSQTYTKVAIEQVSRTLADESTGGHSLMLSAVANFFHLSFGISGSFVPGTLHLKSRVELQLDVETLAVLIKSARTEFKSVRGFSKTVLGAIARAADTFYVTQKKKSFDAELRTLTTKSTLSKTLEWLWCTDPSTSKDLDSPATAVSLLRCLTSSGSVLPLWDYTSFIRCVMRRFCCVDVSIACVEFAATQANCDDFLVNELLLTSWVLNADARLQAASIAWVSHAALRVQPDLLGRLLTHVFYVVKLSWSCDPLNPRTSLLFDHWTAMLHDLLKLHPRLSEKSRTLTTEFVFNQVLNELSFGPHDFVFVEHFATRVMSAISYSERGFPDTFLTPRMSNPSLWQWWQTGVFFVNLTKANVVSISKRETSVVFQWLVQHKYQEWTTDVLVQRSLTPLIAEIGAIIAQANKPNESVSSLLDVLDALSREFSALDSFTYAHRVKRHALFRIVAIVITWNRSTRHEQYQLQLSRVEMARVDMILELLPFGFIVFARGSKGGAAVGERLLALLQQLTHLKLEDVAEYVATLSNCSRQMHVAADKWCISSPTADALRDLWSMREAGGESSNEV